MDDATTSDITELTAERFRQILAAASAPSASCDPQSAGPGEQRRRPRSAVGDVATLIPFSENISDGAMIVPVRDVSSGGFRFLHHRPIPLGEIFALVLPAEASLADKPAVVFCSVAYWQPLARDLVAIGAQFTRVLQQASAPLQLDLENPAASEMQRKAS